MRLQELGWGIARVGRHLLGIRPASSLRRNCAPSQDEVRALSERLAKPVEIAEEVGLPGELQELVDAYQRDLFTARGVRGEVLNAKGGCRRR